MAVLGKGMSENFRQFVLERLEKILAEQCVARERVSEINRSLARIETLIGQIATS